MIDGLIRPIGQIDLLPLRVCLCSRGTPCRLSPLLARVAVRIMIMVVEVYAVVDLVGREVQVLVGGAYRTTVMVDE